MNRIDAPLLLKIAGLVLAVVLSWFASLTAEEQRPLDPAKPADAIQIIHIMTVKLECRRDEGVALTKAIETVAKFIEEHPEPAPTPTADRVVTVPAPPTRDPKAKP